MLKKRKKKKKNKIEKNQRYSLFYKKMKEAIENFVNMFFKHIFTPRNTAKPIENTNVITSSDSELDDKEHYLMFDYNSE